MGDESFPGTGRRNFLIAASGVVSSLVTRLAWSAGKPCPVPTLTVDGGTSSTTSCTPSEGLPVLTLTSAAASGTHGWTFAQAFKKGDVPSGSYITTDAGASQADVRNRWADGSVKVAVLSGISTFSQNAPKAIAIATSSTTGTSDSSVAEPTSLDVAVTFSGDVTGTYTLQSCLGIDLSVWNKAQAGRVRQILGPVMSEFHYYCPTSDAHVAVWFYVRHYADGATEVETMVENGWLYVANPGEKDYSVTITVNGSTRYSGSLNHYHHTRWSRVDWLDTDPKITPKHDVAYLRATKVVPNYGYTSPSSTVLSGFASELNPTPFARGNWMEPMGNAGYQDSIGLLPRWEALYCTSGDPRVYIATVSNQRGAGRWPIYYRDETTGRVPLYSSYPNLTYTSGWGTPPPTPSGGSVSGGWNIPHHPSNGYLAYLIEGRWSALESLQFSAAASVLEAKPSSRTGGILACVSSPLTTRGAAWSWRTMAQAAAISPTSVATSAVPEADAALQSAFASSISNTATWAKQRYLDGTTDGGMHKNSIGWLGQYDHYTSSRPPDEWWGGSWMVEFQSMALGYASDLEIENLSAPADLAAIRDHSYDNCLLQLGDESSWNFRRGGAYDRPYLKDSSTPSAPVFMTVAEAFTSYKASGSLATLSANAGDSLKAHDSDADATGSSNDANGYWALSLATLAFAVDHGKPGAAAKFALVTAASNYDPAGHGANDDPTWAILPR